MIGSFDSEFYFVDFHKIVCISKGYFHDSLSFDPNIPSNTDDVAPIQTQYYDDDDFLIVVIEVVAIIRSVHFFL